MRFYIVICSLIFFSNSGCIYKIVILTPNLDSRKRGFGFSPMVSLRNVLWHKTTDGSVSWKGVIGWINQPNLILHTHCGENPLRKTRKAECPTSCWQHVMEALINKHYAAAASLFVCWFVCLLIKVVWPMEKSGINCDEGKHPWGHFAKRAQIWE